MSIQAVAWAIRQRVGSPTGKVLLMCLANYADESGECWPSQGTMSAEAELGERATRDWLKTLEDQGFIERQRRHRGDGSRTSDLIRLCLNRPPDTPASDLPAESAGRPNQPASGAAPTGISCRTYRRGMPGNESVREPSNEPNQRLRSREEARFSELWDSWPVATRPNKRAYAQRLFERLSHEDRARAIGRASVYRARWAARGDAALMIPYLKGRLFIECADAICSRDGNAFPPDKERKRRQAMRQVVPHLFVAADRQAQIGQWQDWLARDGLPPLEALGVGDRQNGKSGYRLPSYWPPDAGSPNALEWNVYFRRMLKRDRDDTVGIL